MKKIAILSLLTLAFNAQAGIIPLTNTIGKHTEFSNEETATFQITPSSNEAEVWKVEVYKWTQTASKYTQLTPTDEISVIPQVVTARPGENGVLRVVANVPKNDVQQTYRLVFSPIETQKTDPTKAISVPLNISVPLFIDPTSVTEPFIAKRKEGNKWIFKNEGNVTYKMKSITVNGKQTDKLAYILPKSEIAIEGEEVSIGRDIGTGLIEKKE